MQCKYCPSGVRYDQTEVEASWDWIVEQHIEQRTANTDCPQNFAHSTMMSESTHAALTQRGTSVEDVVPKSWQRWVTAGCVGGLSVSSELDVLELQSETSRKLLRVHKFLIGETPSPHTPHSYVCHFDRMSAADASISPGKTLAN